MDIEVKIEKPKSYIREITISFPYKSLEKEKKRIAEDYRQVTAIPGFRKGKAPLSIILNRFKKEIDKEAQDVVVRNTLKKVISDNNLDPVTVVEIENIEIPEKNGNITFKARFQVIPDFELKLDGIKTIYKPSKVKKRDVKRVIADLQRKYTTLRPAKRPSRVGDNIEFNYKIFNKNGDLLDTAEDMMFECINETDKNSPFSLLLNVKSGETVKGEIIYPKQFPAMHLYGRRVTIVLEINEVKEEVIPKVNDDFAKTLGMNNLKELENSIYRQLTKENEEQSRKESEDKLLETLLQKNNFEVPDAIINNYLSQLKEDMEDEANKELNRGKLYKLAEKRARLNIIFDKIAKKERINTSDKEIDKIIEKEAEKSSINKEKLKDFLKQTGRIEEIVSILRRKETYNFLLRNYLIRG